MSDLISKYNIPGPRYTSYPTVPYWDLDAFSGKGWQESVVKTFYKSPSEGISLYIHLPFCESMCTFCGCFKRITKNHEFEKPYIQAILKEWRLYVKLLGKTPIIKELHLGGGTPTFFAPENLTSLIEGIFMYAIKADDAEFSFEGHPNNTTKAHLQALYDVSFRRVCFGVQDYNESVQKAINRVQPFENVKRVTELARKIGYTSVGHDIIYGLPFQTSNHVMDTIAKTVALKPDRVAFYSYAHVPWRKGNGQRGFKDADLPSAEEKADQKELGRMLLNYGGYKSIGMDHFALNSDSLFQAYANGSLHRNFMGYTSSKTELLIGLGVSSISDSWYAFAQNVKSIEEYMHLVQNDIIPVSKGHLLTRKDELIRKHILDLMCHFQTKLNADISHNDAARILNYLEEFGKDDLVEIEQNRITVTEEGKPFIRNICMAFDFRLHQNEPETKLFSMTI